VEVRMAGRSRSSFNKRLKERSRQDKQREKMERKVQRKSEKPAGDSQDRLDSLIDPSAASEQLALPGSNVEKSNVEE